MDKYVKLFLRFGIGAAFLIASFDRLGFFPAAVSSWGSWQPFLEYTALINPWIPEPLIPLVGLTATLLEIGFGLALIIGFKTELVAKLSGWLLLIFALSMTFSVGLKKVFDYSVFVGSAAAFALGLMKDKYLELDLKLMKDTAPKKKKIREQDKKIIYDFLRFSMGIGFLSAVADRFGLWGAPGMRNVAWGDWTSFVEYTGQLNFWAPEGIIPILAIIATGLELVFAILFLINWKVKIAGLGTGVLLLIFALSMSLSGGTAVFLGTFGMSLYSFSAGGFYMAVKGER